MIIFCRSSNNAKSSNSSNFVLFVGPSPLLAIFDHAEESQNDSLASGTQNIDASKLKTLKKLQDIVFVPL